MIRCESQIACCCCCEMLKSIWQLTLTDTPPALCSHSFFNLLPNKHDTVCALWLQASETSLLQSWPACAIWHPLCQGRPWLAVQPSPPLLGCWDHPDRPTMQVPMPPWMRGCQPVRHRSAAALPSSLEAPQLGSVWFWTRFAASFPVWTSLSQGSEGVAEGWVCACRGWSGSVCNGVPGPVWAWQPPVHRC